MRIQFSALGRVGPDYQYGWGLMNTRAAAELIQEDYDCSTGDLISEGTLNAQNASDTYHLYTDGTSAIRITLCWTDPPATALSSTLDDPSPRLVNDLDLRLIGPGGSPIYYPYVLDPADPAAAARTGDNTVDNVEQVYLASPGQAGAYEVRVSFKSPTNDSQRYSLLSNQPLVNQHAPVAEDGQTIVSKNTSATLTLSATDEGLPQTPGKLTYAIVSLPRHGTLAYSDGAAIAQPAALAQNVNQVVYKPATGFVGQDSFTFCADDGGSEPFGGVSNTATMTVSVQDIATLQYQICCGEDDGISLSGWQAVDGDSLQTGQYTSAMRFQKLQIPSGAQIITATLKLRTNDCEISKSKGVICAEATGDAKDFSSMNPRIYNRSKTQASIAWDWEGTEQRRQWHASPNIATVIQEVVDRSDWSAGNDLVVMYSGKNVSDRSIYFSSWEGDPAYAAKLEVVFAASPVAEEPATSSDPGSVAPTAVDANLYGNANMPVSVIFEVVDDGLPGSLDFTIDSLPAHGSLEYPNGTTIVQPGTLSGQVDRVIYRPATDFTGDDAFTFHANDGGNAPSGGSSNAAVVSVKIRNMVTRQFEVIVPEDDAYGADGTPVVLSDVLSVGHYDSVMRFRVIYRPATDFMGSDSFTFYVDDGDVPESSGESNLATIRVMVRPPLTQTLTYGTYIKASEDDAYATRQSASNNHVQPVLLVGLNSSGFRFTDVDIPQGSKILSAHLTVRTSLSRVCYPVAGIIQAEASDDAPGFSRDDRVVGAAPVTDAFVDWIWYGIIFNNVCISPDIGEVVQEVIDRPDWTAGNAIALIMSSLNVPVEDLEVLAYDNAPTSAASMAPALAIIYAPNDPNAYFFRSPEVFPPTGDTPMTQAVHYWRFDEATGDTVYDSIGIRHGVMEAGTKRVAGMVNGALEFGGQVDYVALPDNEPVWLPQQDFTIAFWVWFDTGTVTSPPDEDEMLLDLNSVVCDDPIYGIGYCVQRLSGSRKIAFRLYTQTPSNETLYTSTSFNKGRWYHVAVVRRDNRQEIYVDGELDVARSCSPEPVKFSKPYGDDDKVSVGRYTRVGTTPQNHLDGKLDEFLIFDRALSAEEIREIYDETAGAGQ